MAMHIYRIDHDKSHTHSWFVTIQRRGRIYHRHFTDTVYGGKHKSLAAAKMYRDTLIASLRPLNRPERCRIRNKNNRSGISGVKRSEAVERSRGRIYPRRYWLAQWPIGDGKAMIKKFSLLIEHCNPLWGIRFFERLLDEHPRSNYFIASAAAEATVFQLSPSSSIGQLDY